MNFQRFNKAMLILALAGAGIGCTATQPYTGVMDADAVVAEENFRDCRRDALAMDASATENRSEAQFLTASRAMSRCVDETIVSGAPIDDEAIMRLQAQSILAQIKGGDTAQAADALTAFELQHSGRDLYLIDSASVIETLHALLGTVPASARDGQLLNVSPAVSAEIKRIDYWQTH